MPCSGARLVGSKRKRRSSFIHVCCRDESPAVAAEVAEAAPARNLVPAATGGPSAACLTKSCYGSGCRGRELSRARFSRNQLRKSRSLCQDCVQRTPNIRGKKVAQAAGAAAIAAHILSMRGVQGACVGRAHSDQRGGTRSGDTACVHGRAQFDRGRGCRPTCGHSNAARGGDKARGQSAGGSARRSRLRVAH